MAVEQHRGRYSQKMRDDIFELWAFYCGQDAAEVVKVLNTDQVWRDTVQLPDGADPPSVRTIQTWVKEELWQWKASERMREMYPAAIRYATLQMATAIQPAAQFITHASRTEEKLTASDKIKLENCWKIWDVVVGQSVAEHLKPLVNESIDIKELQSLSLEELAEQERKMLGG